MAGNGATTAAPAQREESEAIERGPLAWLRRRPVVDHRPRVPLYFIAQRYVEAWEERRQWEQGDRSGLGDEQPPRLPENVVYRELENFGRHHGTVVDSYFCHAASAACVYTRSIDGAQRPGMYADRLHLALVPDPDVPDWILELLLECQNLEIEMRQVLRPPDGRIAAELVFGLIVQLLQLVDASAPASGQRRHDHVMAVSDGFDHHQANDGLSDPVGEDRLVARTEPPRRDRRNQMRARTSPTDDGTSREALFRRQIAEARAFYLRSAQRAASTAYFVGMVGGALVLFFLTYLLYTILFSPDTADNVWASSTVSDVRALLRVQDPQNMATYLLLFLVSVVGSLGAVVSVMQRMTSGTLVLQHRTGKLLLLLVGGFRPIIGAVFALMLCVLVQSGLLPLSVPAGNELKYVFFFAALAFFAGFSERWAQDTLAASQPQLGYQPGDGRHSAIGGSVTAPD